MNKYLFALVASCVTGSTIVAFQPAATAASFTARNAKDAGCIGFTSCTVNGFRLSSSPQDHVISEKTVGGVLGLGVRNPIRDRSNGEIDFGETLSVGFARQQTLKSFDLSFLYQPGVYGDQVFEVALVNVTGSTQSGRLRVTGDRSAVWELADGASWRSVGSVANLSPSVRKQGGSYRVLNPFGGDRILGFSLTAQRVRRDNLSTPCTSGTSCPTGVANSDYALTAVQVPEPTTVAGLGVVGLLAIARRRQGVKAN